MILAHVPLDRLADCWPTVKPGIEVIAKRFRERILPEDVYLAIKTGNAWLFTIGGDVGFTVLRRAQEFNGANSLFVWLIYGKPHRMKDLERDVYDELAEMARTAGCQRVQFWSPRKGWAKRGWKLTHYIYERDV